MGEEEAGMTPAGWRLQLRSEARLHLDTPPLAVNDNKTQSSNEAKLKRPEHGRTIRTFC